MDPKAAFEFERRTPIHDTRDAQGLVNRLRPARWLRHSDAVVQRRTVGIIAPLAGAIAHPVVLSIGVGGGGLYYWMWREPESTRLGLDVNLAVLRKALADGGEDHFEPIEGDAAHLPLRDGSVDVVVFDFVLHHLVGQSALETSVEEGMRVLRRGGFMIAREPSSHSPSGIALNVVNHFGLMNRLSGASNSEFALSPRRLVTIFEQRGTVLEVKGLTYLWSHRLPIWLQKTISRAEPYLFRSRRAQWLADFVLFVVRKER